MTAPQDIDDLEGAAPADNEEDQDAAASDADSAGADQLGDAGKKALDAMKAKWRSERDKAKKLEADLAAAQKPLADDDKPDIEELRKQARAEAQAESLRDRALDKLEAKAARLFQNPEDARAFLASKVDEFVDDGKVDVDAITDALKELLEARPYLGVTQGDGKRFQGTADGGPKGNAGKPQLSKQDVERLSKEGRHDEIEKARQDGRLNNLLKIN